MYLNNQNNTPYYQFTTMLGLKNILHFTTTKYGGVTTGPCAELNMDFTDFDTVENVLQNRTLLAKAVGFKPDTYVIAEQVHGNNVSIIQRHHKGSGIYNKSSRIAASDALVTNQRGLCLIAKTADCVPILLCDPQKRVIAAIHAGWRGTLKKIASKTIDIMINNLSCNLSDIKAGIGPSIGACCYEVGDDVVKAVNETFSTSDGFLLSINNKIKPHLDLWYANRFLLEQSGVLPENIETSCLCTACNDEFFSWRRDGNQTGRLATGIILTE